MKIIKSVPQNPVPEILELQHQINTTMKTTVPMAIRIGELLTTHKAVIGHGKFQAWICDNLPFTDRTARTYMRLYDARDRLKTETVSDLSAAYKLLAAPTQTTPTATKTAASRGKGVYLTPGDLKTLRDAVEFIYQKVHDSSLVDAGVDLREFAGKFLECVKYWEDRL